MDQEIPDYDMDSEDEAWLNKQTKKMDVTPLKFENMMDRLEKGSGQMVSGILHWFCYGVEPWSSKLNDLDIYVCHLLARSLALLE